jgi:hypothetical protein
VGESREGGREICNNNNNLKAIKSMECIHGAGSKKQK